jgi:hypothetical protein
MELGLPSSLFRLSVENCICFSHLLCAYYILLGLITLIIFRGELWKAHSDKQHVGISRI